MSSPMRVVEKLSSAIDGEALADVAEALTMLLAATIIQIATDRTDALEGVEGASDTLRELVERRFDQMKAAMATSPVGRA